MSTLSEPLRKQRAKLGYATRIYGSDSAEAKTARRDFRALRLEEYVQRVLNEAPPLTDEQRERIAALLRAGGAA